LAFSAPPPTGFYTLSLHDALPISALEVRACRAGLAAQQLVCGTPGRLDQGDVALGIGETQQRHSGLPRAEKLARAADAKILARRSEEYTSELQSRGHLVCRLLLEK